MTAFHQPEFNSPSGTLRQNDLIKTEKTGKMKELFKRTVETVTELFGFLTDASIRCLNHYQQIKIQCFTVRNGCSIS